jgi:hypothetical protein
MTQTAQTSLGDLRAMRSRIKRNNESGWWFGTLFIFPYNGIIIPTDFHIFQRGRYTTNQE